MLSRISWCTINTQICEDWISSFKINWSGDDFMKYLYDCGKLFWYCRIQGMNENISIFQPYVSWSSLVVWWCEGNVVPKFGCRYEWYVSYFKLLSLTTHTHTHTHTILPHSHVASRIWPTPLPKITSPCIATWVLEYKFSAIM